ncbi:MAG TPA: glycosyltransferase family 2 protein, partial [Solimonas sp.]
FTRACLDSLEKYSDYPNLELIAVDNASSDETPALLSAWAAAAPGRRHIANGSNLGFAGGNNVGLAAATGEYLVILNNDTFVTPGWVSTLVRHFRSDPSLGVLGPVTNNIGNEARIEIGYTDMAQMLDASGDYTARHAGLRLPLQTAAFFCVMLPRRVYEAVGGLDEAFGIGMFEDDDYCRRVEQAGWTVACAEDVFVHHHLSASFDQIKQERRQQMFEQNKAIYEAKWGPWVPHRYREQDAGKLAG